jgi:nicotinic acid mononucleotide adenylyltransferase
VAARTGAGRRAVLEAVTPLLGPGRPGGSDGPPRRIRFLDMPAMEVSSSMARERVARGAPIADLVGEAVAGYIHDHGLYAGRSREGS